MPLVWHNFSHDDSGLGSGVQPLDQMLCFTPGKGNQKPAGGLGIRRQVHKNAGHGGLHKKTRLHVVHIPLSAGGDNSHFRQLLCAV